MMKYKYYVNPPKFDFNAKIKNYIKQGIKFDIDRPIDDLLNDKEFLKQFAIGGYIFPPLLRHYIKIPKNIYTLDNSEELKQKYPALWRIIGRLTRYLIEFNEYSYNKVVSIVAKKDGNFYFFGSCRYFSNRFKHGSPSTWNRNLNIFCTLGLVDKIPLENIANRRVERRAKRKVREYSKKLIVGKDILKEVNFYTIPLYDKELLTRANQIAENLIQHHYRLNGFSKIFLIKAFGNEFAKKIFPDDRYVSEYSNYVATEIENYILADIKEHGYTTKKRVIEQVNINYNQVKNREYGFYKTGQRGIIEAEFNRHVSGIISKNSLKYTKVDKDLKKRFSLSGYITILYKPE